MPPKTMRSSFNEWSSTTLFYFYLLIDTYQYLCLWDALITANGEAMLP